MSICPRCGRRHNDHGGDPFAGAYCLQCKNSMRYDGRGGGGGNAFDSLIRKVGFPLLIIGFVGAFIVRYMAYVVCIGIIAIVCFLTCKYFRHRGNSEFKVFITVLISLGLVGCVFLIVPRTQYNGKQATLMTRNQSVPAQARFMLVNADVLNVRGGPSTDHDVVEQLTRDARVQVLDSSGQWWRIRFENIEGFVYSTYLINEGTATSVQTSPPKTSVETISTSSPVVREPWAGTTRDPEFQRAYEEAVSNYDVTHPVLPPGLVLPDGRTVQEHFDSEPVSGR